MFNNVSSENKLTVLLLGHMMDTFVGCLGTDSEMVVVDIDQRYEAHKTPDQVFRMEEQPDIDLDKDLKILTENLLHLLSYFRIILLKKSLNVHASSCSTIRIILWRYLYVQKKSEIKMVTETFW